MRRFSKRADDNAFNTMRATQREIDRRWGEDYLREARLRLCTKCERQRGCNLYPVCLDGTDCIYFREKEGK